MVAANIFPGDMLYKNFGVTRQGRVVFYDYDEVAYITDCNFRRIPPPRTPEDEMSAEPWYAVGPNDVFPEEFATFLLGDPQVREVFMKHHARPARRGLVAGEAEAGPRRPPRRRLPLPGHAALQASPRDGPAGRPARMSVAPSRRRPPGSTIAALWRMLRCIQTSGSDRAPRPGRSRRSPDHSFFNMSYGDSP